MTTYQTTNAVTGSTQEVMKVQYTAKTHTSGGRRGGVSRSDDGRLDVKFSAPVAPGTGTNPEQLFAAGWSACFISAMGIVANKIASNDRAVSPELEKAEAAAMKATSITVPSSHVPMLSQPKAVADLIEQAAAKAGSQ
jgi:organic hydroperoxide reductase OsmC/OhrA